MESANKNKVKLTKNYFWYFQLAGFLRAKTLSGTTLKIQMLEILIMITQSASKAAEEAAKVAHKATRGNQFSVLATFVL